MAVNLGIRKNKRRHGLAQARVNFSQSETSSPVGGGGQNSRYYW